MKRIVPVVFFLASLPCVIAQARAQQPRTVVIDEKRLFSVATPLPRAVWTEETADGSRETVTLERPGGLTLRGWLLPSVDPSAPFVLIFRGNNETMADAYSQARDEFFNTALNLNVVTFDYRGTGFSDGTISLPEARADALAIYDDVAKRAAGRPMFVCGWSLGSIFASHVAGARSSLAGLILLDPLSGGDAEKADIARARVAGIRVVVPPSVDAGIQNATELRGYHNPLLVVHGTADHVIAIDEGQDDYDSAGSTDKLFVPVTGKGHAGTIWSIEASDAIAAFILKHSTPAKAPN